MDPLSMGLGIAGIGASLFGQNQTNQMQAQMMQQQQSFQERMSNTAYQRASADMTAAGLNPMMMFSSGSAASSPTGASPSPMIKSGLDADAIQKSVNTGLQSRVQNLTIDKLAADLAETKAKVLTEERRPQLISAQTGATDQSAALTRERTYTEPVERALKRAGIPIVSNAAVTAANEQRINPTARAIADQAAYFGGKTSKVLSPVTDVINSAVSAKRAFKPAAPHDMYETTVHPNGRSTFKERFYNE